MCFNRLKTASHALEGDQRGHHSITLSERRPRIWDLAEFLARDEMLKKIARKVKSPLRGLKVVCYYGCMTSRPPEITGADEPENPQAMDRIIDRLGGTPLDWPYKTDCCGASQALSLEGVETTLVEKLFRMARGVGARGIVVSCQMCQANLDMYGVRNTSGRNKIKPMPVYYFTELIGVALGLKDAAKWLARHITDPLPLLRIYNLLKE
jgi:heterodisulfide reductase subunit B